jgi:type I restriction enzyme S subunit
MSWSPKRLDELGSVSRGRSRHRPRDAAHLYGGPHPFIQTGDVKHAGLYITGYTQTYTEAGLQQSKLWPAGTLCITIAANIADTAILGIDACFPDSVIGFIADPNQSDTRFVKYLFDATIKVRAQQFSQGATQDNLSQEKLLSLDFDVPPVADQTRIADILSSYDDLIENNRRRMALLEESARLLYREWFVRLRFPGYEHTLVVDGVPQGWSITNFGSVVTNFDRLRKPLSILEREQREGEFPYHGAAGILSHIDGFLFDGRYLLIGEDGTVQTSAGNPMLQLVEGRFWVSNHAHVVQGATVSTEFLYCLLADYPIQGHVTGVAQPKITQANLNRIPVMVPSESLQTVFQEFAATIFNQRFSLQSQNQKLRAARDLLLPRLMSGELAV